MSLQWGLHGILRVNWNIRLEMKELENYFVYAMDAI